MAKANPTASRLRELFDIDTENGTLRWRVYRRGSSGIGNVAGCAGKNGYRYVGIDGKLCLEHRIIFFYANGRWPVGDIDHIDGNPLNNALSNIRECSRAENMQNMRVRTKNHLGQPKSSKFPGVTWCGKKGQWRAQIRAGGKHRHLGYFETEELAHARYISVKASVHLFQPTQRQ